MTKKILLYLTTLVFIACGPINTPNFSTDNPIETSDDTIVIGDTVWDNSALIGKWKPYNYHQTYIFEDGVIYSQYDTDEPQMTHRYTNFGNILHIERLSFIETHPSRYAYCEYRINGDTLYIEDFSMTIAAVDPPIFRGITLIKIKE